ncbi:hypothetical protein [Sinorhizobium sp. BJ1]|uniref:hypothetical protein n=1 Tax=Sinorhizobium sp. BJ1 TaxID=2035455 RepID=UPI00247804CC|nr:hypothetical protein [Sinorhizobium sp. BJ1]
MAGRGRPRTGGDDDLAGRNARAVHLDTAVGEARRLVAISDAVVGGQQLDILGLAQRGDERILLGEWFRASRSVRPAPCAGKRTAARALCRVSAARISVFGGTQPTLTQVPLMVPLPSRATWAP